MALLIVLAFTVILLGLVAAYFSKVTNDRSVSDSSLHQAKADQIATTAMQTVIGDLRQEIINGSTATTIGGYTIYTPTASTFLPARSGNPSYTGGPANDPIPNLVRRSWFSDTNLNPRSRASQVNSTTDFSLNNHNVTLPRWNKHYLISRTGAPAGDTTPSAASGFVAPDWVLITRGGATAETGIGTGTTAISNATPSNTNYVLGRYAYAVYDEGGLIDVNVAGFPTNTTPAQYGLKGVSAFADLTQIPGITQTMIDYLVSWRNYAAAQLGTSFPFTFTSTAATNYVNYVTGKTNGFFGVSPISGTLVSSVTQPSTSPYLNNNRTNQQFPNRQSLIQFRSLPTPAQIPEDSLQYLGTYSRELNAPSWTPTLDASDMGGSNGPSNIYAYRSSANPTPAPTATPLPTPINPNFVNVRVATSFVRADGSIASAGEPLVRRFPLTRLAGVGATGPVTGINSTMVNGLFSPASAATIQRDFGLLWDSTNNRWNYVGATGSIVQSSIKRLDQVAAESPGREPNFFELLKAAILSGSVGLGSGSAIPQPTPIPTPTPTLVVAEKKYYYTTNGFSSDVQIIQIGANIIDWADSDKNPTFIGFKDPDTATIYESAGVENLPFLNKVGFQCKWTTATSFSAWVVPCLWNPLQNAATVNAASATIPTVRFAMPSGTLSVAVQTATGTTSASTALTGSTTLPFANPSNSNTWQPPDAMGSSTSTKPGMGSTPDSKLGIPFTFSPVGVSQSTAFKAYPIMNNVAFEMQAQIGGSTGPWKTYQRWSGCTVNTPTITSVYQPPGGTSPNYWTQNTTLDPEYVLLDPRTMRFGVWETHGSATGNTTDYTRGNNETLDRGSGTNNGFQVVNTMAPQGSSFSGVSTNFPGAQMGNNTSTLPNYKDLDGVVRQGDPLNSTDTSAMLPANTTDRPLILSTPSAARTYGSVAELGQVFRDQPWKALSFTSATAGATAVSGDAALLDVFSLHETTIEAGKTSLNTRQTPVLNAILSQAAKKLNGPISADLLTSPQVIPIVAALQNLTIAQPSSQPMVSKAELVTRLAADASVTGLGSKEARESVIRAFADAGQTRTWTLLIDVIAQSGRYPPNAQSLKDFLVSGEQHYWAHVAIDRFTGQVIDKQIEVVNE